MNISGSISKKITGKKNCIFLMLFFLIVSSLCVSAFAHPGRTDSSGGHRDNQNVSGLGYYHYHHGYSAHLHEGGICPYEQKQPIVETYEYIPPVPSAPKVAWVEDSPERVAAAAKKTKEPETLSQSTYVIAALVLIFLPLYFQKKIDRRLHPIEEMAQDQGYAPYQPSAQNATHHACVSMSKSPAAPPVSIPNIPPQYTLGTLGLPADVDAPKHWGKTFTVYLNPKTHIYHRGRCRYVSPATTYATHILLVYQSNRPCQVCRPELPDLDWYLPNAAQNHNLPSSDKMH